MPFLECLRRLEMITPACASHTTAPGGGNQALTSMAPGMPCGLVDGGQEGVASSLLKLNMM